MADEQDPKNSRLLFSDLDVSDKGRPPRDYPAPEGAGQAAAAATGTATATATAFATPLTSIAELASSLEFGFEEDFDDIDFKAGVADAEEARPASRAAGLLDGDDPELDLLSERLASREIYRPAFPEMTGGGAAAVPTWEEFTGAYDLVREPGETDAQFAARRWREARRRRKQQFADEFAKDTETASMEDPLLDEEVDVLAVVDPDEWRYLDEPVPGAEQSGPREEPEEEGPGPAATQVINPRERLAALELAASEAEAEAARRAAQEAEPPESATGEEAADAPESEPTETDYLPNPTDTLHEMFSDVDLEALWQEQVEKRNRSNRQAKSDSRVVDLFDEVDLDAAWEERVKAGLREGTMRIPELALGETLIVEPGMLDNGQTAIMNPEDMPALRPAGAAAAPDSPDSSAQSSPPATSESARSRYRLSKGDGATLEEEIGYADEPAPETSVSEDEAFGDLQSLLDGEEGAAAGPGAGGHEFISGIEAPTITTDDVINTITLDDEPINAGVSAPVIDDSAISRVHGPRPGTEEMQAIMGEYAGEGEAGESGEGGEDADGAAAVAVDPMDVFANMDDMTFDFSDDMDDEMRAMLDDDGDAVADEEAEGGAERADASPDDIPPEGRVAKLVWRLRRYAKRHMPERAQTILDQITGAIAWQENWWFYCDLLAAIIASASLAVIISYYVWYR